VELYSKNWPGFLAGRKAFCLVCLMVNTKNPYTFSLTSP